MIIAMDFARRFHDVIVVAVLITSSLWMVIVMGEENNLTPQEDSKTGESGMTSHPCLRDDAFNCHPEGDDEAEAAQQECVKNSAVCDGVRDCSNARDESVDMCGCLASEFQCNATTCIDLLLRCDKTQDCLDGTDELDCETYICPITHIKCTNHVCVPRDKECDFVDDCGDYSDEENCKRRDCYMTEFRCNNSQCVSMGHLCDGTPDCLDASDEDRAQCDRHFKCPIGLYVSGAVTCDGWVDCYFTHWDELNCGDCKQDEYKCPNSQCINEAHVCDGVCDCVGCEDEDTCATYACLREDKFLCHPKGAALSRCIPKVKVCDATNDCMNTQTGWDESLCAPEKNCSAFASEGHPAPFYCPEGRCLPATWRCDGYADCLDGLDEEDCDVPKCERSEFTCSSGQCVPMTSRCDAIFDCFDRSDEANCASHPCASTHVRCKSGQCIPADQWCDFLRHCPDGSDERDCEGAPCQEGQFRCHSGQCIEMTHQCYNGKAVNGQGCADHSNLLNCSSFECREDEFKCREGYCIDKAQECDGNVDCRYTHWDERNCTFACPFDSKVCLCKSDQMTCEDRLLTAIPTMHHKESFSTILFAGNRLQLDDSTFSDTSFYKVTNLDLSANSIVTIPEMTFASMLRLTQLSLGHNNITRLDAGTFVGLSRLRTLHLYGNHISSFHYKTFLPLINLLALDLSGQNLSRINPSDFRGLRRVLTLNLAFNTLDDVPNGAFIGLHDLLLLNLSGNRLRALDHDVFSPLAVLETLDLSSNQIHRIASGVFNGMVKLRYLDLSSNKLRQLGEGAFLPVKNLETLLTDHYKFCCLASSDVTCLPEPDEFSSCEDLMSNHMLRISIWILGVIALLGNMLVIIWRLRDFRGGRVHSFLITNLAIGDLLMGVYLLIIASVDLHYRGHYIIHDEAWRASALCRFAGFVSTFSSELSVLTLTTITLDRLLCILFPLRRTRLGLKQAVIVMSLIWVFVFLIAITPFFGMHYFVEFYGRSGVCLALHVTPDRPAGWEYSVAIFLVLNFASFLVIAVSYLWMFIVAKKTRSAVRTAASQNDNAMARRMTVIVMTDFCCWVPIILLGFLSLAGTRADNQVYAWIAVFVLPLNSATNPILYTLSTAPFLGNVRKRVTVFRKSFINSITADTKHSYVDDRTTHYYYDRKSPYRQLELIRLRSLNNSAAIACYSKDHYIDT